MTWDSAFKLRVREIELSFLRKLIPYTGSLSPISVQLKNGEICLLKPRKKALTFKFFPVILDQPRTAYQSNQKRKLYLPYSQLEGWISCHENFFFRNFFNDFSWIFFFLILLKGKKKYIGQKYIYLEVRVFVFFIGVSGEIVGVLNSPLISQKTPFFSPILFFFFKLKVIKTFIQLQLIKFFHFISRPDIWTSLGKSKLCSGKYSSRFCRWKC